MTLTAKDLAADYAELRASIPDYDKAQTFFEGTEDELFASPKVRRLLQKNNLSDIDNFNFAKTPVTTVADRLKINSITVPGDPDASEAIDHEWRRNHLALLVPHIHLATATLGDYYAYVGPLFPDLEQEEENQEETGPEPIGTEILCADPRTIRAYYSDSSPIRPTHVTRFAAQKLPNGDILHKATVYYPTHAEDYTAAATHTDSPDPTTWTLVNERPLPYGIPYHHYRTALPYGRPEHFFAYGPQIAINKLIMGHLATVDYQSFPQRYGLIDPTTDDSNQNQGDPYHPEDEDDDPESRLNVSRLSADPSAFWMLQGLKAAGQFDAANPENFLKPLKEYIENLAMLTDTPLKFMRASAAYERAPSGASKREDMTPLVAKIENRQTLLAATHIGLFTQVLDILGYPPSTPAPTVSWKPPFVYSDTESWDQAQKKMRAGLPPSQALHELGYTPAQIEEWTRPTSPLMQDLAIQRFTALAEATAKLSGAVAGGAIDSNMAALLAREALSPSTPSTNPPTPQDLA
jgi:hypothetical protein